MHLYRSNFSKKMISIIINITIVFTVSGNYFKAMHKIK